MDLRVATKSALEDAFKAAIRDAFERYRIALSSADDDAGNEAEEGKILENAFALTKKSYESAIAIAKELNILK